MRKETQHIEFKPNFNEDVIETLVAFANAKGGKVLVGVNDKGSAQNPQKWQYPLEAIREIVLNMIIHRDYRSSSDSIVKIFNDKIEFYNQGRLPDNISVEDLLTNNYKSTPRNKKIAEFFKDLGLIEKYGSGIRRIIGYFKEENLPLPKFENISDGFQVTVYPAEMGKDTEKDTEKLSNNQTVILKEIRNNNNITVEELSVILGINLRNTKNNILKLKTKGLIERIGITKRRLLENN
jgi:ATP-dependent DNA helicase RecG